MQNKRGRKKKSWKLAEEGVIVKADLSEKLSHIFSIVLKKYREVVTLGWALVEIQNKGIIGGNKPSLDNIQNPERVMRINTENVGWMSMMDNFIYIYLWALCVCIIGICVYLMYI